MNPIKDKGTRQKKSSTIKNIARKTQNPSKTLKTRDIKAQNNSFAPLPLPSARRALQKRSGRQSALRKY